VPPDVAAQPLVETDLESQFVALIRQHQGILHKVCRVYQSDPDERDDLLQEITLQLWKSFATFRGAAKVTTWMYRVALNTAITYYRRQARAPQTSGLAHNLFNLPTEAPDPEKEERLRLLYGAVEKLSKIEKAIVMLYLEDHTYEEVAAIVGITQNYVRVKMSRIITKLKKDLHAQR